ncbi:hypothetical protein [Mesorhizobium sp. CAU 1741]|uniref:hypothetical protein n=1 Tax=Mesorhizobium sp. CAU 1741 TaxID=3140366 RepID=UPI00325A6520
MPYLSNEKLRLMRNKYDHDVARYLAETATRKCLISYGELGDAFGRSARGWGDVLGGIALRCHEHGLPLLPVIVVEKKSRLPSTGALLYKDLGMIDDSAVATMQQRCFEHDWSRTPLG